MFVPFQRLLHQGTITELAVMDEINSGRVFQCLYNDTPYDHIHATVDVGLYAPHDIHVYCANIKGGKKVGKKVCTVEVKSTNNGGKYNTFFAEMIQTKSMGYAEYLVHPPTWIVYVDVPTRQHYWYDGNFFVNAVKAMYKYRYQPRNLHAEGIKFAIDCKHFGYLGTYRQTEEWDTVCDKYDDIIKMRLKKHKNTIVHKRCLFLPTLQ
jgi:hypothetical protein